MRAMLSLVSLLLVLAVVGWLAKSSLSTVVPSTTSAEGSTTTAPAAAKQQVQAYEQALKETLEAGARARASEAAN